MEFCGLVWQVWCKRGVNEEFVVLRFCFGLFSRKGNENVEV